MEKSDLKPGMLLGIEYDDGVEWFLYLGEDQLLGKGFNLLEEYNNDLTFDDGDIGCNIVAVGKPKLDQCKNLSDIIKTKNIEIIWERNPVATMSVKEAVDYVFRLTGKKICIK